jgi:hypothetical protein
MDHTDDFGEWLVYHCTAFGLNDDKARGVAAWRAAFDAKRYTLAELRTATDTMLSDPPVPKYLTDHLDRIHAIVREQRRVAGKTELKADDEVRMSSADWMPHRARLVDEGFLTDQETVESVRKWRAAGEPKPAPTDQPVRKAVVTAKDMSVPF